VIFDNSATIPGTQFPIRVLGGGDFVDSLKAEFRLRDKMKSVVTLAQLLEIVATALTIDPDSIRKPSKSRGPAAARGVICHLAIYELGYTGREVGKFLHLGPTGVSLASRRGDKILKADSRLTQKTMGAIDEEITVLLPLHLPKASRQPG
jgi:chromosomal replication initiation ATPase DnaA